MQSEDKNTELFLCVTCAANLEKFLTNKIASCQETAEGACAALGILWRVADLEISQKTREMLETLATNSEEEFELQPNTEDRFIEMGAAIIKALNQFENKLGERALAGHVEVADFDDLEQRQLIQLAAQWRACWALIFDWQEWGRVKEKLGTVTN